MSRVVVLWEKHTTYSTCWIDALPYILVYKSQNLWRNLAGKVRGRLITGS